VQWYLEEIEGDIDSEAELLEKKAVIEKVIYRLIHHVRILINYCYMFLLCKCSKHTSLYVDSGLCDH